MEKPLPKCFLRMGILFSFCLGIFNQSIACGIERDFSEEIKRHVQALEYPQNTAEEFSKLANSWKDKTNESILKKWSIKIAEANSRKSGLSQTEEDISQQLAEKIKSEITFNENYFELPEIINNKQAQCLGYTQIFYILGNSIGLKVQATDVIQMRTGKLSNAQSHVANIVSLSDGKKIIADLVPNGFISVPFTLEEQFQKHGDIWELKEKNNPLGLDRKFKILNSDELIAFKFNNRASSLIKKGNYTEAINELSKAVSYYPAFAEAYHNRAIAFRNTEKIEQAVADCNQAIKLNDKFAQAYVHRGIIYSKTGQLNLSIFDYTKAIEIDPEFANAYFNRGIAYNKTGKI